jgi:hypothetical protein
LHIATHHTATIRIHLAAPEVGFSFSERAKDVLALNLAKQPTWHYQALKQKRYGLAVHQLKALSSNNF